MYTGAIPQNASLFPGLPLQGSNAGDASCTPVPYTEFCPQVSYLRSELRGPVWYALNVRGPAATFQVTLCNAYGFSSAMTDSMLAVFVGEPGAGTCAAANDDTAGTTCPACGCDPNPLLSSVGQLTLGSSDAPDTLTLVYFLVGGFNAARGPFQLDATRLDAPLQVRPGAGTGRPT